MQRLEDIQRIARGAVTHFLKKLHWAETHVADLMQEAVIAILSAEELYDAAKGPWEKYAMGAACKAVQRYLQRNRTVVVSPRPGRGDPVVVLNHSVEGLYSDNGSSRERLAVRLWNNLTSPSALPPEQLDAARLKTRVRAVLRRLDDSKGKLAVKVLLDEKAPAEVRKKGMRMKVVRYAVKNTTRRAGRSVALQSLAAELLS